MFLLKVTVERIDGYCNQPMLVGDHFFVEGGKIRVPEGKHICMWVLQSMMPIFPLPQRAGGEKETGLPRSTNSAAQTPRERSFIG